MRIFFFQAEDGIRDYKVTGVQTCALPISTEVGAEAYLRSRGFMAMLGVTNGEIRGQVRQPNDRAPTYLAKAGFDRQLNEDLRVRLTGSLYQTRKSISNTIYSGDRAGCRYYSVDDSDGWT